MAGLSEMRGISPLRHIPRIKVTQQRKAAIGLALYDARVLKGNTQKGIPMEQRSSPTLGIRQVLPCDEDYPYPFKGPLHETKPDGSKVCIGLTEDIGDCKICGEPLEVAMDDSFAVYQFNLDNEAGLGFMCQACFEAAGHA